MMGTVLMMVETHCLERMILWERRQVSCPHLLDQPQLCQLSTPPGDLTPAWEVWQPHSWRHSALVQQVQQVHPVQAGDRDRELCQPTRQLAQSENPSSEHPREPSTPRVDHPGMTVRVSRSVLCSDWSLLYQCCPLIGQYCCRLNHL